MNDSIQHLPNQSLAKGLLILESFSTRQPEWGVRELGRHLNINPTTIYRLVATFESAGYLEKNLETQKYRLGPKVIKLANLYNHINPIATWARRIFNKYRDSFDYNFYLGQLSGFEVVYLAALDGRGPIKVVAEPGGTTSLHATAFGKVMLAYQDHEYIERFIAQAKLTRQTERTITDPDVLRDQLKQIREQGYAVNDGESYDEVGAVGVPIFTQSKVVRYCLSLAYPRPVIQEGRINLSDLVSLAQKIAAEFVPYLPYS